MARKFPNRVVGTEWMTSDLPGRWRQDPISLIPLALGAHWGEVPSHSCCKPVTSFAIRPASHDESRIHGGLQ